ncbi:MAG: lipid-A-disaccharide synthase [Desulfobacteraceae bacterium]|nr:lipid-A-disaccharide synthase [Desulfobacteraceae bacterium]MBC2755307.1 lipid-A-disaccharide synthase [Desulfobacteraceae bacterium]
MTTPSVQKCVMIIAGETSGDAHGAHLVRAMKKKDSSLFFCGIGSDALRTAGVKILVDSKELSVVGITEVFAKIPKVLNGISTVKKLLQGLSPDLIILIDFPDFNLHIASIAKKHGVPVLYYVSPQIWAWRSGRIRKIKQNVDHMAVILPFEKEYYTRHNIPATFVGHPLLDSYSPIEEKKSDNVEDPTPVVGLLPGSRVGEIDRNLPYMLASASILQHRFQNMKFLLSVAPSISRQWVESFVNPYKNTCRIELVPGNILEIFEKSTLIIAASGTVTLETAIYGVPMVIMYRISPASYMLGRALVEVDHIGLVNIIANERIVPELIQGEASPGKIARTVGEMLNNPLELSRIKEKLKLVKSMLGEAGASEKTADIGLSLLKSNPSS